jgi:hypothetical protein
MSMHTGTQHLHGVPIQDVPRCPATHRPYLTGPDAPPRDEQTKKFIREEAILEPLRDIAPQGKA